MGYLDYAGLQYLWGKLKEKFAPKSHSHDDRYYTEAEMDGKLNSKVNNNEAGANGLINKLSTADGIPNDTTVFISQHNDGKTASYYRRPISTLWTYIKGKADGVYQPKGSYAASNHSHTKDQVGLGNVDNTADRVKSVAIANFAKETYINQYKTVNLTDLDQNTWYPVTGTGVPYNGLRHFKCNVQLNSGSKPSWSTHSSGFTAVVDILEESSGWGTTRMLGEVLINDQFFIADESKPPVGYQQMSYGSIPVWWLRGGGTYFLAADYDCTWTIQKSKYENSGQSVTPTTTYPGVNVNRATITANLNGNAKTATMANSANALSGLSSRSSQRWGVQTGTFIHGEDDSTGGSMAFRRDCPNGGQLSMVIDGRFYQNEGQYRVLDESDKNQFATAGHTHQYLSLYGARSANINFTKSTNGTGAMFHFVATSSTTTGKPPADSSILQLNWDSNGGWDSQLALSTTANPHVYYRNQQNGTWGNWSTLLDNLNYIDYAAKKEHTHTKAQITDFPSSLKNPTALTIQTNGAIAATYDGSAAKTVNITKGNIGLGNVDNTADANKSVASAAKLTTARTVSGGSDITLSFNYDGSNNSTANIGFYSCKHSIGNTNNYPFHRFAKLDANKNAWVDNSMTFLISQDYSGGGYGICRLVYQSNADSSSASLAAEWLVRKGLSVDTVQVAIKTDKTNGAYCDAFYKSSGGYTSVVIRAIASGGRASLGRTWTLINSNETDGTTATDKKTSSECWKTIADAGNELHKQAYSSSASAVDGGYVASAGSANSASTCTGNSASATKLTSSAGSATQPIYFKDGKPVAGTYTLGDASSKMVRTLGAQGNTGWTNKTTDDKYVPTMSFMAYWNGAYGGTSSNLQYCDRGRFGTIVTKGSGDYAAAGHTHDDRYYTESEVNTKLANYQPKGSYAAASHTHNYAGSGSAGGSANSAIKLDSSAGSATQPVYFKDGKPVATTYALNKTVPADAKFTDTNTWRGIQNNLTSDSTDQSLSAAQGKALKTLVDGKAPASHKHTKSQITDFPTSMPASDVSAWAKAATKPSYTKAEVGLSNVDNTADKDKSVKYAASAGSASQLNGFTIQASTSDLTAGYSRLNNNVIYIVYE